MLRFEVNIDLAVFAHHLSFTYRKQVSEVFLKAIIVI